MSAKGQGKYFSGMNVSRVKITTAASGNTVLVAGVAGKTIKVLSLVVIVDDDVSIKFISGTTDLTGVMKMATAGNGFVLNSSSKAQHWLEADVAEDFIINLSGAIQASGWMVYVQENPALV